MKNEIQLNFHICDYIDITSNDISEILNIEPMRIIEKGQRKNKQNIDSPVFTRNFWIMTHALNPSTSSFDQQMEALLDIIEPKLDLFKNLCSKYFSQFSCIITIKDKKQSTPWIHLNSRYNKIIKELNSEFDVDINI